MEGTGCLSGPWFCCVYRIKIKMSFKGHPPLPFHQVLWKSVDLEVFLLLLQNCTLQYGCHNNIWKLDKMGFPIPHSISFPKMYSSLHLHLNSTSVMQRTTTERTSGWLMSHVLEETWLQSRLSQDRQAVAVPVGTGSTQDWHRVIEKWVTKSKGKIE